MDKVASTISYDASATAHRITEAYLRQLGKVVVSPSEYAVAYVEAFEEINAAYKDAYKKRRIEDRDRRLGLIPESQE